MNLGKTRQLNITPWAYGEPLQPLHQYHGQEERRRASNHVIYGGGPEP